MQNNRNSGGQGKGLGRGMGGRCKSGTGRGLGMGRRDGSCGNPACGTGAMNGGRQAFRPESRQIEDEDTITIQIEEKG